MSIAKCELCGEFGSQPNVLPTCSRQDCPRAVAAAMFKKAFSTEMKDEFCPQCLPCKYAEKMAQCEDAMRDIAFYLGVGGYNTMTFDPEVFRQKIRWGIEHQLNVAKGREWASYAESLPPSKKP